MLTEFLRRRGGGLLEPVAKLLSRTGISPNGVTILGLLLTGVVAYLLALGHVQLAGAVLIVAALFDAIDGAMARLLNQATRFGAFFDSTVDRFAEIILFLGVLIYYQGQDARLEIILTYLAIVGSLMVSYTRARAEGVGISIKGGILTRVERMGILILCLLLNWPVVALWILAILTNTTALQRVWLTWQATKSDA
jgi:CDP-diacylglycerol--glycerol-3-phosphate 3-phosphatidyltransferase